LNPRDSASIPSANEKPMYNSDGYVYESPILAGQVINPVSSDQWNLKLGAEGK
jgi:hypothetical protein